MFAITGVTGQVGGTVATQLLQTGLPVRAILRNAEKGKAWREKGAELALAEMTDADALTAAFTGAEGVFLLIPPTFDPTPGFPEVRAVIAALKTALLRARPERVVCLSTIGAQAEEPNLLSQLGLVEQELSRLPLPIAFLRAAWFMENAAWDVATAREAGVIASFLQPLDQAYPMVSVADVGERAASLLQESWTGKRIVELQGPEKVTPADIAAAFSKVLGKPVSAEIVARDSWEALFQGQGMRNPTPRIRMIDGFNEGWICFEGQPEKGSTTLETAIRRLVEAA
ncbi:MULTISPECIES: NmrA family NAD(P)-binding protein [unclassified Rhizobium]|uniref:NmrA family NAD(P)-binding protein n=1 Tax=unclassified Rhizobium TaxID=2613769 RepID=UPI001ADACF7E|nr:MULTISPECIES: NmrA family NAD(P)-binding protein [unclassified Rhizobium]MBO9122407.1 NmrA family NAD(P)-binding protein [Rhizobium sp. 16-488-2b]MBO9172938.1 NmrA family NAD(P)-binding protein [Rhizobium sp. 16-488-2a]